MDRDQQVDRIKVEVMVTDEFLAQFFMAIMSQASTSGMNKVELIKFVRSYWQEKLPTVYVGLKGSKDYVDEVERRLKSWVESKEY